jgi:hypothetical protein
MRIGLLHFGFGTDFGQRGATFVASSQKPEDGHDAVHHFYRGVMHGLSVFHFHAISSHHFRNL